MSKWAVNSDEWYPVYNPFRPDYESEHHVELDDALVEAYIAAKEEHERLLRSMEEAIDADARRRYEMREPKRDGYLIRAVLADGTVLAEFWQSFSSGQQYWISLPPYLPEHYWACGVPDA